MSDARRSPEFRPVVRLRPAAADGRLNAGHGGGQNARMAGAGGVGASAARPEDDSLESLVRRSREGDPAAGARLFELLHDELRRIAASVLGPGARDRTLQPTAVVHEAFLKLGGRPRAFNDRGHFLATAARAMRQVFADYYGKHKHRKKRGAGWERVPFETVTVACEGADWEALDFASAMRDLETIDARAARVVWLRLAQMEWAEIAAELGVSDKTAKRDWDFARAYLKDRLGA